MPLYSAHRGRWDEAFRLLDQKDKATLDADRNNRLQAEEFIRCVENKQAYCESKQWTLFTKNDGTEVKIRDVLGKIASWIKKFEPLGDAAAHFGPVHASLPWTGVKFLIEVRMRYKSFGAKC